MEGMKTIHTKYLKSDSTFRLYLNTDLEFVVRSKHSDTKAQRLSINDIAKQWTQYKGIHGNHFTKVRMYIYKNKL